MRVVGGSGKGKRLYSPGSDNVRPTTDQVKEAIFNILPPLDGKYFLDLFAGSGGVGIEALSRGAEFVAFVEKNAYVSRHIKKNIDACRFQDRSAILTMEVKTGVKVMQNKGFSFDVIFLDPPYDNDLIEATLEAINYSNILLEDGEIIVQRSIREKTELDKMSFLIQIDERKYGDTILSFFNLNQRNAL